MAADLYADAFAGAGLSVLLYDHFSLGLSDGEPRGWLDPWLQARGYVDAISFLRSLDGIDSDRIAVWGDSLSGSLALIVGAVDERVAVIVVQVPACGASMPDPEPDDASFQRLREVLLHADLDAFERDVVGPLPVVSPDQLHMPSHLLPITAYRWFIEFGGRYGTGWLNRASFVQMRAGVPLESSLCAPHIEVPTLMVSAQHDEMPYNDADVSRSVLGLIGGPTESVVLDGGHFGLLYPDTPEFAASIAAQRAFLVRQLQPSS